MGREDIILKIRQNRIIAIIRGIASDDCIRLAEALYQGGIRLVEITFDQSHPESWISTAKTINSVALMTEGRMEAVSYTHLTLPTN